MTSKRIDILGIKGDELHSLICSLLNIFALGYVDCQGLIECDVDVALKTIGKLYRLPIGQSIETGDVQGERRAREDYWMSITPHCLKELIFMTEVALTGIEDWEFPIVVCQEKDYVRQVVEKLKRALAATQD